MRTLNVKMVTVEEIERNWKTPLPSNWSSPMYVRCNAKGAVKWENTNVYTLHELILRGNYKIQVKHNFLSQLYKIESELFSLMGDVHQLTINKIQYSLIEFLHLQEKKDDLFIELMYVSYDIENILEIINPKRTVDIAILTKYNSVLNYWIKSLEN